MAGISKSDGAPQLYRSLRTTVCDTRLLASSSPWDGLTAASCAFKEIQMTPLLSDGSPASKRMRRNNPEKTTEKFHLWIVTGQISSIIIEAYETFSPAAPARYVGSLSYF